MSYRSSEAQSLAWLVNSFVAEVPGVTHAVVVSADGLLLIASDGLSSDDERSSFPRWPAARAAWPKPRAVFSIWATAARPSSGWNADTSSLWR